MTNSIAKLSLIVLLLLLSGLSGNAYGAVWYVDGSVGSSGAGSSWATAFKTVQEGLDAASTGDEVWVASGTYYPASDDNRFTSIQLTEGVELYGGFDGTETSLSARDWEVNETILSGDIGTAGVDTDNSVHVVRGAVDAVIDGFIIEKGYASLKPHETCTESGSLISTTEEFEDVEILRIVTDVQCSSGGGLYNVHANTIVRNCIFRHNTASKGGAVYNMVVSYYDFASTITAVDDPYFENVTFLENYGSARGGAVNNDFFTSPTFVDCQFIKNHCDTKGGGVYGDMGAPGYFINTLFARNTAERAGAVANDGNSSNLFTYTTMVKNIADDLGASLYQGTYLNSHNEPHMYYSLVMGNESGASPSSISNWHDDAVIYDGNSTVEETDGVEDVDNYLNQDYSTQDTTVGWDPSRDTSSIVSSWTTQFASETSRTSTDYSYTSATAGVGVGTIYVDIDAAGGGDGSSWGSAYNDLSTAIDAARTGQEIWVAEGTYYPTTDSDRTKAFEVRDGVDMYGGFAGTETLLSERDSTTYQTILDGDIGVASTATDNSYHVVVAVVSGTGANNGTIDGFTIRNGYADGDFYHGRGGGLMIYNDASPTVSNNTFTSNYALEGGAVVIYDESHPTFTDNLIDSNSAQRGGGMMIRVGSDPSLDGTDFTNNSASDRGGALFIDYGSSPTISNCSFTGNSSVGHGGAVYVDDNASQYVGTEPVFTSCTFSGNTTAGRGGAIYLYNSLTDATGSSVTITGNSASLGGGGVAVDENSTWVCTSCNVTSNTADTGTADVDTEDTDATEALLLVHNDLDDIDSGATTIDFGSVEVGSSLTYNISLWNRGNADLNFSNANPLQLSGTNSSDFSVSVQPATSVTAHRSESATLVFQPTSTGSLTANVTIANDSSNTPSYTFTVTGTGTSSTGNTVGLISSSDDVEPGYTLFAPITSTTTYLIDNNGEMVHSWPSTYKPGLSTYLLEDGRLLRTGSDSGSFDSNGTSTGGSGGIVEMIEWDGTVSWSYSYVGSDYLAHHDVEYLPNGNILMIAWESKSNAEALAAGRDPSTLDGDLWTETLIEIDPDTDQIVWQWNAIDHLVQDYDSGKPDYGTVADSPERIDFNYSRGTGSDWLHFNSIDYNPDFDQILISVHSFSEIWVIDHSTTTAQAATSSGGDSGKGGDLLYRWGNPKTYDQGSSSDQQLFSQHDARWIETGYTNAGNITIYNNGQMRNGISGDSYSTVDEIVPPVDGSGNYTMTGSSYGPTAPTWTYEADTPTDFYSASISGAQRQSNGNTLICEGESGNFFEVSSLGNIVWQYINPVSLSGVLSQGSTPTTNSVFRAERYAEDYAGFDGRTLVSRNAIEDADGTASIAVDVAISGTNEVGETLTGSYTFLDAEGDSESGTTYQWYRADDSSGTNAVAISGATSTSYTLTEDDEGKYITFTVTTSDGTNVGSEDSSDYTDVVSAASSSSSNLSWLLLLLLDD